MMSELKEWLLNLPYRTYSVDRFRKEVIEKIDALEHTEQWIPVRFDSKPEPDSYIAKWGDGSYKVFTKDQFPALMHFIEYKYTSLIMPFTESS